MHERRRRETVYDPTGASSASDEHALDVSALMRELQAHLDRVRRGEASEQEQWTVSAMVGAARRARRER